MEQLSSESVNQQMIPNSAHTTGGLYPGYMRSWGGWKGASVNTCTKFQKTRGIGAELTICGKTEVVSLFSFLGENAVKSVAPLPAFLAEQLPYLLMD